MEITQKLQIKEMQSAVNKVQNAIDGGTGGYYNDTLISLESEVRHLIGDFWDNNENENEELIYNLEISEYNIDLITSINKVLKEVKKLVKIEKLMEEVKNN